MIDGRRIDTLKEFGYEQKLERVLGLPGVCLFGFAYLAPCTIFSYFGLVNGSTHGMISLAYAIATIAMFFTALSYRQMVVAFPVAGSVYSYVGKTMHPNIGFMAGWAILLGYILLPMINYIIASGYIPILLPGVPIWADIFALITIVTVVNLAGVKIMSAFDNIFIVIQLAFVIAAVIFAVKTILSKNYDIIDISGLWNASEWGSVGITGVIGGASVLCLCFLGFDSVTTLAEETKNPGKTVGRALIIVCLTAGGLFVLSTYLFQLAWPDGWMQIDSGRGSYQLVGYIAGQFMATFLCVVMIVSCLASAVSSQASCARILFGMGRDHQLPARFFGHISTRFKVPSYNIILIGVVSLLSLYIDFDLGTTMINFGALLGFTLVNISVFVHYWMKECRRGIKAAVNYIVLLAAGASVCISLWVNLGRKALIIGSIWLVIGGIVLLVTINKKKKGCVKID